MNNTPSWDRAPEWVNYRAQDEDGKWYWYELKPYIDDDEWPEDEWHMGGGKVLEVYPGNPDWKNTLEKRP